MDPSSLLGCSHRRRERGNQTQREMVPHQGGIGTSRTTQIQFRVQGEEGMIHIYWITLGQHLLFIKGLYYDCLPVVYNARTKEMWLHGGWDG